jgi:DNA-binding transcriptional MerR regulator
VGGLLILPLTLYKDTKNVGKNKINMKTTEEIKSIIEAYNELNNLVVEKIEVLKKFDPCYYDTSRGVENISFYDDTVHIICDDFYFGCNSTEHFCFPLSYLSMDENDLKTVVQQDKEKREELNKKLKEQKENREKEEERIRELNEYNRLKQKFGV